jgi:FKBP12-rapamycin complex-associated protein
MPDVVSLIVELWENPLLQLPLVSLVEALGKALDAEFKPFLPTILPLLLKLFDGEVSEKNEKNEKKVQVQIKVFDAFFTFGTSIEEYMQLVIPIVVRTYERAEAPLSLRKRAVQTIDGLSRKVNFSDHASRIIHPLVRVLGNCSNELWPSVMDCLCSMVIQLGSDFAIFIPTIQKVRTSCCEMHNELSSRRSFFQVLHTARMGHPKYENLIAKLLNGERLPREVSSLDASCVAISC